MSEQIIIAIVTGVCGLFGGGAASGLVTAWFSRLRPDIAPETMKEENT